MTPPSAEVRSLKRLTCTANRITCCPVGLWAHTCWPEVTYLGTLIPVTADASLPLAPWTAPEVFGQTVGVTIWT